MPSFRSSLPRIRLASLPVVALLAAAAVAQSPAPPAYPQLLTPAGPEGLMLVLSGEHAAVARGEGRRQEPVTLPRGGTLSRIEAVGDEWVAAGTQPRDEGRELLLVTRRAGVTERLPPPPRRGGQLRHDPVPLVYRGQLVGLAWLQGEGLDRLAVWAAAWNGARWQGLREVSPAGAGSQLALTGAVLEDGSWLLAWSGFDGESDEILWSLRRQEAWSAPRRAAAANAVPDITPALVATAEGALLAWSRFEGDGYRLLVARWTGEGWSEPDEAGGPGSLYPEWRRGDLGAVLLHRQARAGSWELVEVDEGGRPRRRASMMAPAEPRPVLASPAAATLLFPDGRAEALDWRPALDP